MLARVLFYRENDTGLLVQCDTHWVWMTHICVKEQSRHWFRQWLIACSVPSHSLNQCRYMYIVNWTLGNNSNWNLINTTIFWQENVFKNVANQEAAILSWPQCGNMRNMHFEHYSGVIMGAMASQITSIAIVYSTLYSRRRSKKTSKLCVTGLFDGNSPVTGEFRAQRASNAENVSIWWRHHGLKEAWAELLQTTFWNVFSKLFLFKFVG